MGAKATIFAHASGYAEEKNLRGGLERERLEKRT